MEQEFITFCGHSKLTNIDIIHVKLQEQLTKLLNYAKEEKKLLSFLCGGYGDFDNLAKKTLDELRGERDDSFEILFVTPYLSETYLQKKDGYDDVIYPPIENKPKRYAILSRNQWMIEKSTTVISFVNCDFGGAYKTLCFARKKQKNIIDLTI